MSSGNGGRQEVRKIWSDYIESLAMTARVFYRIPRCQSPRFTLLLSSWNTHNALLSTLTWAWWSRLDSQCLWDQLPADLRHEPVGKYTRSLIPEAFFMTPSVPQKWYLGGLQLWPARNAYCLDFFVLPGFTIQISHHPQYCSCCQLLGGSRLTWSLGNKEGSSFPVNLVQFIMLLTSALGNLCIWSLSIHLPMSIKQLPKSLIFLSSVYL